jgi:hypothetical protein
MEFDTAEREKRWREDHLETFQERDRRPGSTDEFKPAGTRHHTEGGTDVHRNTQKEC